MTNSGSAYGSGHLGYGLYTSTMNGAITITNSAYVHVNAGTTGSGMYANLQSQTISSPVAVSNSGYVKVTGSSAYGIEAEDSSSGSVTLTNSAGGMVSTASSGGSGGGLYVNANTGVGTVTNNGTVTSTDTGSGTTSYGLKFYGDNFVASNTGTRIGTEYWSQFQRCLLGCLCHFRAWRGRHNVDQRRGGVTYRQRYGQRCGCQCDHLWKLKRHPRHGDGDQPRQHFCDFLRI